MTYALLIEDEPTVRASYTEMAKLEGLSLLEAATWDEGLTLFQVNSPVLVIADYNLPGSKHGLQLLAEIRQHSPWIKLVLLSSYIDLTDAHDIEATGLVDRALPKTHPDTIDILVEEIRDAKLRADAPTDWRAHAEADLAARAISGDDVDALDARVQAARFGGTK